MPRPDVMSKKNVYKETLNLPETDFPMRANLVEREPVRLAAWDQARLYQKIQEKRQGIGAPKFVLHDGPPFANGDVHMGTALNKLLKDFIVKSRCMSGFESPYIPGWDCHGLPIEFKVVKEAKGLEPAEIRRRSEAFARKYIDIQRHSFKRLGVLGDWENPYLTFDPRYEADIIRVFAKFVESGLVYQSKKPVSWSFGAQTALAEAEIEYEDKTSPAVFVKFPLLGDQLGQDTSLVIWTTTPWTLPANLAIALHAHFDYLVDTFAHEDGRRERLVMAKELIDSFGELTGFHPVNGTGARSVKGAEVEGLQAQHPFLDRVSKIITAPFVTAETGTGAVHIAPGHGQDDYAVGRQHGLEILSPVDDKGCFTEECGVAELVGLHVFKANSKVIEILEEKNALLGKHDFQHSYPHCWRSKTPIVFRAVEQFFIKIDAIRDQALAEIEKVQWLPEWGQNRIAGTVAARPDWCISRQRSWGVPLPVFRKTDGEWIIDADLARKVAEITESEGTNAWFELSDEEWARKLDLPEGTKKGRDTLDVWIDSGSSHVAVLDRHPALRRPADIYIEATDQHRGWFQSSLMVSVATHGAAPYKTVITHGFVVDTSGKKISKSAAKGSKPLDAKFFYEKYGADNLRLWAASVDYNAEVPFSEELFQQVVEAYRRLRNTIRVLLGNLKDFDPAKDAVPFEKMTLVDRWILTRLQQVTANCRQAYDAYEFRKVYNELNQFCAVDLSSLYIDITKDRLYCDPVDSGRRRATQTAMARIADTLCRLLAPVISYTADEAWEALGHDESVHLELFPDAGALDAAPAVLDQVQALIETRHVIQKAMEEARQAKTIARNDEAVVTLSAPPGAVVFQFADEPETLTEFFIVSELELVEGDALRAEVVSSKAGKCARCWRYVESVGKDDTHPELCQRCSGALPAGF